MLLRCSNTECLLIPIDVEKRCCYINLFKYTFICFFDCELSLECRWLLKKYPLPISLSLFNVSEHNGSLFSLKLAGRHPAHNANYLSCDVTGADRRRQKNICR